MPTLNIEGKKVKVGDDFLNLSPEDQQRTVEEIASQMGVGASSAQSFTDTMRKQEPSTNIEDTTQPSAAQQWMQGVGDRSGAVLRGVPLVGPYMDEIKAGVRSGFGYAGDYGKELESVRSHIKKFDEENPKDALIGQGLGLLGSAVAAAPLAAASIPASLTARMGMGALTGGGIGAVEGFGRGEGGLENRAESAKEGAMVGTALGAFAPVAAAGVGKVVRGIKWTGSEWKHLWDKMLGQGVKDRKAVGAVLRKLEKTGMSADDAAARLDELGPEGMLADVNEGMQVATGRVARKDLGAANTVGSRLTARDDGARARQAVVLDKVFGPEVDPYVHQMVTKTTAQEIGKGYAPLYDKVVPYTHELEALSKRIPPSAIKAANDLMKVEGIKSKQVLVKLAKDGSVKSFERVPDMQQWDYIQRGLRTIAEGQDGRGVAGGTNTLGRAVTNLRSELLDRIDETVPEFRAVRSAYRGNAEVQDAYEVGLKKVLHDKAMTPARIAIEQAERSGPARDAVKQGLRTDLSMMLSNARENPVKKADRIFTKDLNDRKISELVGPQSAGELRKHLDAELDFAGTSNFAHPKSGSKTPIMLEDPKPKPVMDWPGAIVGGVTGGPAGAAIGASADVTRNLMRRGLDSLAQKAAERLARAEADILTATGARRGEIIRDLGRLAAEVRKAGDAESSARIMAFIAATSAANRAPNPQERAARAYEAGRSYLQQ